MNTKRNDPTIMLGRCIDRAREIAASGEMSYKTALDQMAAKFGVRDWEELESSVKNEQASLWKAFDRFVTQVSLDIIAPKPDRGIHKRDMIARWIMRTLLRPILAIGIPIRWLEKTIVAIATISTFGCAPLAHAVWHDDKAFPMQPELIVVGITLSTTMSAWLASRWLVMSGDPNHAVTSSMRAWAVHSAAIATIFGSLPMVTMAKWSSTTIAESAIGLMSLLSAPMWIAAMQISTLRDDGSAS